MIEALTRCSGGADRFVVVDTETTGVYPSDRVVEVAIFTLALDGTVIEVFDTLINPCRDVSASHIHGITAAMVRDAPTFEEIAGDIAVRLHGACMVAHNIPFDTRMLVSEFGKLGDELVVLRGIDTYVEAGCRLTEACAEFDIDLSGPHCARHDAWATAQLFLRLAGTCDPGAPLAAPFGLNRSGRIQRRDDAAPSRQPDPPLITYLASRLPLHGLAVRSQQYLDMVGRAMADLHLDRAERAELEAFARQLELAPAQTTQAHRRYVNELVDAVLDDDIVTDDEYDRVVRVASALDVDQNTVEQRIASSRLAESLTVLTSGMQIVFTGDHPDYSRDTLLAYAASIGLIPSSGVSKSTSIVCAAEADTTSGKATKARRYGIPVITVDEFVRAKIGDLLAGTGAGQVGLKVITCRDCLVNWTVPATSTVTTLKLCDPCASIAAAASRSTKRSRPARPRVADTWAPPTIEWLSCRRCTTTWHRQTTKGRKPHYCPQCTGVSELPPPITVASAPPASN